MPLAWGGEPSFDAPIVGGNRPFDPTTDRRSASRAYTQRLATSGLDMLTRRQSRALGQPRRGPSPALWPLVTPVRRRRLDVAWLCFWGIGVRRDGRTHAGTITAPIAAISGQEVTSGAEVRA